MKAEYIPNPKMESTMQNEPTNARFPGMLAAGGCLYTSAPGNVKTDPLSPPPPIIVER
ncbi:hypothetical protein AGMMS50293_18380 [Spirochaetia bacterium]|nr:hypothetical protein AGMMS50293_18380 [Spirochaetia bacterium]